MYTWIMFGLFCLFGLTLICLMLRARKVVNFRHQIVTLLYEYYKKNQLDNPNGIYINNYVASYNDMLFSFKPLKLEYWMSNENLNILTNVNKSSEILKKIR